MPLDSQQPRNRTYHAAATIRRRSIPEDCHTSTLPSDRIQNAVRMTPNYSLFTIPAYLVLAMIPHAYSIILITSHDPKAWNNTNPRSSTNTERIQKAIPRRTYQKYERLRAAHNNMMENMAFVVGAVLAGNMARLEPGWLNNMCGAYLMSRVLYVFSFAQTETLALSPLRTIWYSLGQIPLFWIYGRAGMRIAAGAL